MIKGYDEWTNWSSCLKSCGLSEQTRTRVCIDGPCSNSLHESRACQNDGCEYFLLSFFSLLFTQIGYSQWENWSICSKTRGTGQKTRARICLEGPCNGLLHDIEPCRLDGGEYLSEL